MQIKQGSQTVGPAPPKPVIQTPVMLPSEKDKVSLDTSTDSTKSPSQTPTGQSSKESLLEAFTGPSTP